MADPSQRIKYKTVKRTYEDEEDVRSPKRLALEAKTMLKGPARDEVDLFFRRLRGFRLCLGRRKENLDLTLDHFKSAGRIGSGGSGDVYLTVVQKGAWKGRVSCFLMFCGKWLNQLQGVAGCNFQLAGRIAKQLMTEIQVMYKASNFPNVVDIFNVMTSLEVPGVSKPRVWIVMEFMDMGSLDWVYRNAPEKRIPEPFLALIATRCLLALKFLHENRIVHRDIKPGNILCHHNGDIKLADFGISRIRSEQTVSIATGGAGFGSPSYKAPEQLLGRKHKDNCDMWSLGVTLLELAIGKHPYDLKGEEEIVRRISREPEWGDTSLAFRAFITALLTKDPKKRLTSEAFLELHLHERAEEMGGSSWLQCAASLDDFQKWLRSVRRPIPQKK